MRKVKETKQKGTSTTGKSAWHIWWTLIAATDPVTPKSTRFRRPWPSSSICDISLSHPMKKFNLSKFVHFLGMSNRVNMSSQLLAELNRIFCPKGGPTGQTLNRLIWDWVGWNRVTGSPLSVVTSWRSGSLHWRRRACNSFNGRDSSPSPTRGCSRLGVLGGKVGGGGILYRGGFEESLRSSLFSKGRSKCSWRCVKMCCRILRVTSFISKVQPGTLRQPVQRAS